MRRCFVFLTAAIAAVLTFTFTAPGASAQHAARATVPFDFVANHTVLPAGCYRVGLDAHNYLTLVSCDTGRVVGLMVRTTKAEGTVGHSRLLFYPGERAYRLTEVQFSNTNSQSQLAVQPKPGEEMARNATNKTVEVAMK